MREEFKLAGAGFIGSVISIGADAIQKGTASAANRMASSLNQGLSLEIEALWTLPIVALVGAAYCAFMTKTPREAFTTGLAILAVLTTFTPYEQGATLPESPGLRHTDTGFLDEAPAFILVADRAGTTVPVPQPLGPRESVQGGIVLITQQQTKAVRISLKPPEGGKAVEKVTLEVFEAESGKKVGTKVGKGTQLSFGLAPGEYEIRIAVSGYKLVDEKLTVTGDTGLEVPLEESGIPLPLQKLLVPAR